jgi:hypothetical protein
MKLTRVILFAATGAALSTGVILTACNKSSSAANGSATTADNNAVSMSTAAATADNQYNDVLNVGLQIGAGGSTTIGRFGGQSRDGKPTEMDGGSGGTGCAVVSAIVTDTTVFPVTVAINFGTGCTGLDGITRAGTVTYVFSGPIFLPGSMASATFINYTVNGYQLAGTYSITNTSTGGALSFVTSVVSGKVTFPDARFYTYAGTRTVTQTAGIGTLTLLDDSYSVTGVHLFGNSSGASLADSVTTPLVWPVTCNHIVSGIIGFTYTDGTTSLKGTLDYGNGTCDSTATITVGPVTKTVELP